MATRFINSYSWWSSLRLVLVGALFIPTLVAHAQDAPAEDGTPVMVESPVSVEPMTPTPIAAPHLEDLPGTLLLGSTRSSSQAGDSIDKYRLFTMQHGQFTQLHVPDEALGSTSAALSQDGQRLLLNAGGQSLYVVDLTGAAPPRQLLDRLPPFSISQTDAYLSVAWSPDATRAIVVRPFPHGMALLSLTDGSSSPLPLVAQFPTFSPDGGQLALSSALGGAQTAGIYTASLAQPTVVTKLTASTDYETAPEWLLDGSGIAYVAAGDRWELRMLSGSMSAPVILAQAPDDYIISGFAVAPGGRWVAYSLLSTKQLHRYVRIASTTDQTVGLDVPQTQPWNDRVLGWVPGS